MLLVYIDSHANGHRLEQIDFRLNLGKYSADFPIVDEKIIWPLDVHIQPGIAFDRVMHGHRRGQGEKRRQARWCCGIENHREVKTRFALRMPGPSEPASPGRLRFRDDNGAFGYFVTVGEQARRKSIRRVYAVEVIHALADHRRPKPAPEKPWKNDIGQTNQPVTGKELTANFHAGLTKLVDPPHQGRVRNAEISSQLLARNDDHHVLHECVEKLVEFSVNRILRPRS